MTRDTTLLEKLAASAINATLAGSVALLLLGPFDPPLIVCKWGIVVSFFSYNLLCEILLGRCLGMRTLDMIYAGNPSLRQRSIYVTLYTLSFASVLIYVWLPGDLLLINLICIQAPCVYLTWSTLHWWLSGGMKTLRKRGNNKKR